MTSGHFHHIDINSVMLDRTGSGNARPRRRSPEGTLRWNGVDDMYVPLDRLTPRNFVALFYPTRRLRKT